MNRRLARLLGMTLLLAATTATPAVAADELGLSLDQVHWSSSISTPLFDPSLRWVPGDSESATFYIRNQAGDAGDLTVDLLGSTAGNLIDSGDLHITAKGGGGDWTTVSEPGRHRLLSAPTIAAGQVVPIEVAVVFDAASVNQTQLRATRLTFRITLSQSRQGPGDEADDPDGAPLPDTGGLSVWALRLAAFLVLLGLALSVRANRRVVSSDV